MKDAATPFAPSPEPNNSDLPTGVLGRTPPPDVDDEDIGDDPGGHRAARRDVRNILSRIRYPRR